MFLLLYSNRSYSFGCALYVTHSIPIEHVMYEYQNYKVSKVNTMSLMKCWAKSFTAVLAVNAYTHRCCVFSINGIPSFASSSLSSSKSWLRSSLVASGLSLDSSFFASDTEDDVDEGTVAP
jgi:hypothetical protein